METKLFGLARDTSLALTFCRPLRSRPPGGGPRRGAGATVSAREQVRVLKKTTHSVF